MVSNRHEDLVSLVNEERVQKNRKIPPLFDVDIDYFLHSTVIKINDVGVVIELARDTITFHSI